MSPEVSRGLCSASPCSVAPTSNVTHRSHRYIWKGSSGESLANSEIFYPEVTLVTCPQLMGQLMGLLTLPRLSAATRREAGPNRQQQIRQQGLSHLKSSGLVP